MKIALRLFFVIAMISVMGATVVMAGQNQIASDVNGSEYYSLVKKLKNNVIYSSFIKSCAKLQKNVTKLKIKS